MGRVRWERAVRSISARMIAVAGVSVEKTSVLGIVGAALVLVSMFLVACDGKSPTVPHDDSDTSAQLRFEAAIVNAIHRSISRGMLWLFVPTGAVSSDTAAEMGARLVTDNLGNSQLVLELRDVGEDLSMPVSLRMQATRPTPAIETGSGAAQASDIFLASERFFASGDEALNSIATSLRGQNPIDVAKNVAAFLQDGESTAAIGDLELARHDDVHGPETGPGGFVGGQLASEPESVVREAFLATALFRANGIPARIVCGFVDDGDGLLAKQEVRLWAEYLQDESWMPFLPDLEGVQRSAIRFRVFGRVEEIVTGSLVDNLYQGVGLALRMGH